MKTKECPNCKKHRPLCNFRLFKSTCVNCERMFKWRYDGKRATKGLK